MKSVFAALVAIVVAFATVAAAQTNTGEVAGVVMDASGGVLPGATVTATHPASGTVVTRDAGARLRRETGERDGDIPRAGCAAREGRIGPRHR